MLHFSLIAVKEKCVVDPRNKEDIEIVMNELQKLRMMADFLQIVPVLFLGVQECKVLFYICGNKLQVWI